MKKHVAEAPAPTRTMNPRQPLVGLALAAVLVAGIAVRVANLDGVSTRSPDEQTYVYNASRIADQGLGVMPELFARYESDRRNWIYPCPSRFGHVLLFAAAMTISGVRDASAGAGVSCLFSSLSLILVAWIGWRFLNPWIALGAAVFLAFYLGEIGMAQRAWQDAVFSFLGLLLVYLACEITRSPRRVLLYPAFLAVGAYSLLTKESGVLSYGLTAAWVLGVLLIQERSWKGAAWFALGGVISVGACMLVWSLLAGGWNTAISAVNHSFRSGGGAWAARFCSGPWYQFSYLLWLVGPATAALALVGTAVALVPSRLLHPVDAKGQIADWRAAGVAALITLGFFSFSSFVPNYQYLRIFGPADGPYCLLAALGAWYLLSLARRALPVPDYRALAVLFMIALGIAALRDYRTFRSVVAGSDMQDMVLRSMRQNMQR